MIKNLHRYRIKSIRLENIDKKNGHPTVKGMTEICKQILCCV